MLLRNYIRFLVRNGYGYKDSEKSRMVNHWNIIIFTVYKKNMSCLINLP